MLWLEMFYSFNGFIEFGEIFAKNNIFCIENFFIEFFMKHKDSKAF